MTAFTRSVALSFRTPVGSPRASRTMVPPASSRAARIPRAARELAGGTIVRDARGEPTGVLKDNATDLVNAVMPNPPAELEDRALDTAMAYVAAQGVTSVVHMGTSRDLP